jgi:hypothetical protein
MSKAYPAECPVALQSRHHSSLWHGTNEQLGYFGVFHEVFEDHIINGIGDEHDFESICSKNIIFRVKGKIFWLIRFCSKKFEKKSQKNCQGIFFFHF